MVYPHASYSLVILGKAAQAVYEELWTCDLCSAAAIELVGFDGPTGGDASTQTPLWRRQAWPERQPRDLPNDVPEMVRVLYAEASLAENAGTYRLAGVGYRAAVEEICKERGATGNTLWNKITDLEQKGLPSDVIAAMHEARVVGNDSVHHNVEYSAEEIADLAELITETTEILYVQPAQRRRMAEARKQRSEEAKRDRSPAK
jgi:hypothetical protein